MQKFFRIESPQQPENLTSILNNPSMVSIMTRPKTSQPYKSGHIPDEGLRIFRVRPKLISKEAFKSNDDSHIKSPISQNLFKQDQHVWDQLEQSDKGPRMDDKGTLLKYSLVGSVQAFNKELQIQQGIIRKASLKQGTTAFDIEMKTDGGGLLDRTHDTQSRIKTGHSMLQKSSASRMKKQKNMQYKEQYLTPQEVEEQILNCKNNIQESYTKAQALKKVAYAHLQKGDQLYLSSFERVNKKFGQTVDEWQLQEQRFASQIGRKADESIYRKSEQARTVKEVKNLLDAITTDHERIGDMAWQYGLRQPKSSIGLTNPFKFADLDGKGLVSDQRCPVLEVIRKPQSSQMRSKFEGKSPYTSFTSGVHYDAKLSENHIQVHKLLLCQPNDVMELEVLGQSVIKNEIASLTKSSNSFMFVKRILKEEVDEHVHQHPPEIVDVQWDRKQLLRQGKYGIAKTSFFVKDQ